MWKVPVCLVIIYLSVHVNALREISLNDLLERLVTLEDWKRETDKEVLTLRETVAQQGGIIKNLERDLAVQANLTASLKACTYDNNDDTHEDKVEKDADNASDAPIPSNRVRPIKRHNQIQNTASKIAKREIAGGIAFTVYLDHDVDPGLKQTIKFNQAITNDGNAYNTHTGVFTCAEAGVYLFSFFIGQRSETNSYKEFFAELVVNGKLIVGAVVETQHIRQDSQGGNTVVVRLNRDDAVWVAAMNSGHHIEGSANLRTSTFTGVYLYA